MNSSKDTDCGECVASERCWQERVEKRSGFAAHRVKPLSAGDLLVRQGDVFAGPYLVTGGCVAVVETMEDGRERIVAFRVPGELIGVESWHGAIHRYAALSIGPATVCRLRWGDTGLAGRPSALVRKLLAKVSAQLDQATRLWPGLPAAERVRRFVRDFAARSAQEMPMTRAQIGRHLGIAEETVVRALARPRHPRKR